MKIIGRTIAIPIAMTALALGGCGGAESDKTPEPATGAARDRTQDRALLNAVQQPLDRAHEVEDIAAGRKGELDKEIEQAAE